jgi:hypothetical protein
VRTASTMTASVMVDLLLRSDGSCACLPAVFDFDG